MKLSDKMPEIEVDMEEAPASSKPATEKGAAGLLGQAFDALKDDDREGFVRLMKAAIGSGSYAEDD